MDFTEEWKELLDISLSVSKMFPNDPDIQKKTATIRMHYMESLVTQVERRP